MPKDALGHGSNAHAAAALASGPKSAPVPVHDSMLSGVSDATWQASMPRDQFDGGVQDLLGLWAGTQRASPLSAGEKQELDTAYSQRGNWRAMATQIASERDKRDPNWEAKEPR